MKREYFFEERHLDQIREGAYAILDEIGVKLGRSELVEEMAAKGFRTNGMYVKIDKDIARRKLESQQIGDSPLIKEPIWTFISAYSNTYEKLDGTFEPITTESNAAMARFAVNAAEIWPSLGKHSPVGATAPGLPQDVAPELQFFRQAVNNFIWCKSYTPFEPVSLKTASYYFDLCEAMGKPKKDMPIYVASPLTVAGESFDIALAFKEKLENVYIGAMPSFGANTPLNLIAAYAQTFAETLGGAIVFEELSGVRASFSANLFTFDFDDLTMPFGTPDKFLLGLINDEVNARINGGQWNGPCGVDIHTNAPRCGIQACIEKTSLTIAGAMLGATGMGCAGTLGMDELFSPVQLLLDLEMLDHVQRMINGMPFDEFDGDLIAEVREGMDKGYFMTERTADNMFNYIWRPHFFTRKTFKTFTQSPFPIEVEKARDMAEELMNRPPVWRIDEALKREAERIFEKARNTL